LPRFSVVVPTRDRPDLLNFCLQSLAAQTFGDFEVIVSDNPVESPARESFDRWASADWRYVRAKDPMPMHDNFEYGCAQASGDYVAVVIDKTALHPSALEVAHRALVAEPSADIVTWWNEGYDPIAEGHDLTGRFVPAAEVVPPTLYAPAAELARRFANDARRGADPVHYVRGKIVFGAYSSVLLDRIRECAGRVFHPLTADYTSMVPACVLSNGGVDVGRPLLVSFNSARSNGRLAGIDPGHARRFVEAADAAIVDALPIRGLYASVHNLVAYDLVSAAARCPAGSTPSLDLPNLLRRAREDLDAVVWSDSRERDMQHAILESEEARLGVAPARAAPAMPRRRSLRRMAGAVVAQVAPLERFRSRRAATPVTYASPVDAAREADRYYAEAAATPRAATGPPSSATLL